MGLKVVLNPLSLRKFCEDQIKIKEERKEKKKAEKAREKERENQKFEANYERAWKWNVFDETLDQKS
ncbi:hypothetical protein CR513_13753, partial [Mucuna pruriens]